MKLQNILYPTLFIVALILGLVAISFTSIRETLHAQMLGDDSSTSTDEDVTSDDSSATTTDDEDADLNDINNDESTTTDDTSVDDESATNTEATSSDSISTPESTDTPVETPIVMPIPSVAPISAAIPTTSVYPATGPTPAPIVVSAQNNGTILIRGVVEEVSANSMTVRSWGGTWTIRTNAMSTVVPAGSVKGDLASIAPGNFVGVQGSVASNQEFTVDATFVRNWTTDPYVSTAADDTSTGTGAETGSETGTQTPATETPAATTSDQ